MRTNTAVKYEKPKTHGGAVAPRISKEKMLRRSVMSCLLWENEFYEDGVTIAERIRDLASELPFETVASIAIEAREDMKLRHVPLWLAVAVADRKAGRAMGDLLERIIRRPDEMTEFLSLYWLNGKRPLAKQVKRGLGLAFRKFSEYQLAKWDRAGAIKLRDVLFLSHAKPKDDAQADLWRRLVDGKLETPNTWEVALSGGADKRETFERMMSEGSLGGDAFVKNLRNMKQAGVPKSVVREYAGRANLSMVLPFRFVSAANAVPGWEDICDDMLLRCAGGLPKLPGKTVIVIDVSGSMGARLSRPRKDRRGRFVSDDNVMTRLAAAGALAAILREVCEDPVVYATAGDDYRRVHATMECPARRGMSLVATFVAGELNRKIGGGGIFLTQCMDYVFEHEKEADRIIVLTDEQDCSGPDPKLAPDKANAFGKSNYLINVASARNGVGYGRKWNHVDGWSENVVRYITAMETGQIQ